MIKFAIGDVHGCSDEFEELCNTLRSNHEDCSIYQLGDLIDRGPHLYKVIEVCIKYGVISLIGNHEMNFMREAYGYQVCRSQARKINLEKFANYSKQKQDIILRYMKQSRNYVIDQDAFLSHAPPSRYGLKNISAASASAYCTKSDDYDFDRDYADFPANRFIHAHQHWSYVDITEQLKENRRVLNIDSGLVYGGELTAINIKDPQEFYQVKAKKVYFQAEKRK